MAKRSYGKSKANMMEKLSAMMGWTGVGVEAGSPLASAAKNYGTPCGKGKYFVEHVGIVEISPKKNEN